MRVSTLKLSLILAVAGCVLATASPAIAHSQADASLQRQHIEDRARSVMGTRYSYGGGSPSTGFDCSGFTS